LPVVRFEPVLIETLAQFIAAGLFERPLGLRAPVRKPVGCGLLLGLTPFGLLARGSEINEIAHAEI